MRHAAGRRVGAKKTPPAFCDFSESNQDRRYIESERRGLGKAPRVPPVRWPPGQLWTWMGSQRLRHRQSRGDRVRSFFSLHGGINWPASQFTAKGLRESFHASFNQVQGCSTSPRGSLFLVSREVCFVSSFLGAAAAPVHYFHRQRPGAATSSLSAPGTAGESFSEALSRCVQGLDRPWAAPCKDETTKEIPNREMRSTKAHLTEERHRPSQVPPTD